MSDNPYAAPKTEAENLIVTTPEEDIRQFHFSTESSIKSIGVLFYLSCFGFLLGAIVTLLNTFSGEPVAFVLFVIFAALTALSGFTGHGLRTFKPWAKIVATIYSIIGLLGFPLGTILNIYFLCLYWGKKGRMIFTPEYQNIIDATPHLRYRTSKAAWIVLLIFVLLLVGTIAYHSITGY